MPSAAAHQEFMDFMVEYNGFLAEMCADEREKMSALGGRSLSQVEHSIAKSQANSKKLAAYEQQRIALQQAAGYGGLSFRELIDKMPEEEQRRLKILLSIFEGYVKDIRFYNDKSMAIARQGMGQEDAEPSAASSASNPYEKTGGGGPKGLLETKV